MPRYDESKKSILLFCDLRRNNANTIDDHAQAFERFSQHRVFPFDPIGQHRCWSLDLDEFDVVVLHYSVFVLSEEYLNPEFKQKLRNFRGLKIQFIQDDYRRVDEMAAAARDLGVQVLFTLYPKDKIPQVWTPRLPKVECCATLAGYVPDNILRLSTPPIAERTLDVGYRGRSLPYWLGDLGQEKGWITREFQEHVRGFGLTHDVSSREEDRIYGRAWSRFITSCKTMLGTESGSSITDFDGSIQSRTEAYLKAHPGATYEEVRAALLEPHEGNCTINTISPRAFESAALRTAMVLFPGEYSGVLKPWRHYIPLEKDFSNFPEVVRKIRDHEFLQELVDRTYDDLIASGEYSYRSFIAEFDKVVNRHCPTGTNRAKSRYRSASRRVAIVNWRRNVLKKIPFVRTTYGAVCGWWPKSKVRMFALLLGARRVKQFVFRGFRYLARRIRMRNHAAGLNLANVTEAPQSMAPSSAEAGHLRPNERRSLVTSQ